MCPTGAKGGIENIREFSELSNPEPTPANENPGAVATATGANQHEITFTRKAYRTRADAATALCHAFAACEPEDAITLMSGILDRMRAGMPGAPLFGIMHEAAFWADMATPAELKAYALASYARMSAPVQRDFLAYVQRGVAA